MIYLMDGATRSWLTREDGVIETLSAVFYLIGFVSGIFYLVQKAPANRFWMIFWTLLCFFCFGEEISWFQRILNYDTPAIMENANEQGEFNLHNLYFLYGGHWVDAIRSGQFKLKLLLSSQNLFRIGLLIYFFLIPVGQYILKISFFKNRLKIPVPGVLLIVPLWIILLLSFVLAFFSHAELKTSLAETREMFYAFFIMCYLFSIPNHGSQNHENASKI
jgi:hypothetical protein